MLLSSKVVLCLGTTPTSRSVRRHRKMRTKKTVMEEPEKLACRSKFYSRTDARECVADEPGPRVLGCILIQRDPSGRIHTQSRTELDIAHTRKASIIRSGCGHRLARSFATHRGRHDRRSRPHIKDSIRMFPFLPYQRLNSRWRNQSFGTHVDMRANSS